MIVSLLKKKQGILISSIKTVNKCKYNNILKREILHSSLHKIIIKVQKLP